MYGRFMYRGDPTTIQTDDNYFKNTMTTTQVGGRTEVGDRIQHYNLKRSRHL
jgi:hypothetical protein